jgi:DNA polymerase-3 subunit epsilon
VAREIVDRLRGRIVVGHVITFDIDHLTAEFHRSGFALPPVSGATICTRELVKLHLPAGSRTLRACCERLGLTYDGAHSALGDARAAASLFVALRASFGDCGVVQAHFSAAAIRWPDFELDAASPWTRELNGIPTARAVAVTR